MARVKRALTEEDRATRAFDVTQTAEYLSLDRTTVLRMCNQGRIKAVKIGRDWRISKAELDRLLLGEPQAEKAPARPGNGQSEGRLPSLSLLEGLEKGSK